MSDRSFYALLWDEWLDKSSADIPPEAETNTTTIVSEFDAGGMTSEEIWLRYYATDSDKELWRSHEPNFVFPPHTDPPYDRDCFLPTPPIPLQSRAGWLPSGDDPADGVESDLPDLNDIDHEISAAKDKFMPEIGPVDSPDSTIESQLHAMDPENWAPSIQQLAQHNIPLLPPAEITPEALAPILWELLHNLSLRGFYVLHTNHLSDCDLYTELWERGLRDPAHLPGRDARGGWFHDFLGCWGEAELQLWLRYYASEEERATHTNEWPGDIVPPKEQPPFDRDWRLPKGPF